MEKYNKAIFQEKLTKLLRENNPIYYKHKNIIDDLINEYYRLITEEDYWLFIKILAAKMEKPAKNIKNSPDKTLNFYLLNASKIILEQIETINYFENSKNNFDPIKNSIMSEDLLHECSELNKRLLHNYHSKAHLSYKINKVLEKYKEQQNCQESSEIVVKNILKEIDDFQNSKPYKESSHKFQFYVNEQKQIYNDLLSKLNKTKDNPTKQTLFFEFQYTKTDFFENRNYSKRHALHLKPTPLANLTLDLPLPSPPTSPKNSNR